MSVTTLTLPNALPGAQPKHSRSRPVATPLRQRIKPMSTGLDANQRRIVIGVIFVMHVVGLWAVLQVPAVRQAVADAAPMFVDLLAPPAPPAPPPPPLPVTPPPVMKAPPLIVATPKPQTQAPVFTAEPEPIPEPPMAAAVPVEAPPAPPQPAPPPKMIPASAVEYLEKSPPEYPRLSARNRESGRSLVRVFIDERGLSAQVLLQKTSGFPRLDDAALSAVKKWRFKPYTENGRPASGWAVIPLDFELDR